MWPHRLAMGIKIFNFLHEHQRIYRKNLTRMHRRAHYLLSSNQPAINSNTAWTSYEMGSDLKFLTPWLCTSIHKNSIPPYKKLQFTRNGFISAFQCYKKVSCTGFLSTACTCISQRAPVTRHMTQTWPRTVWSIHSLVFNLRGRAGRNQSPVMWPVWLWHTASWANSWG